MKFINKQFLNITSLILLKDNTPVTKIYSKLSSYTFRINITDTLFLSDLNNVILLLDPAGINVQLTWNQSTNQFLKLNDPKGYVKLEPTSHSFNNSLNNWTINFNLTFNWTYPSELLQDIQVKA